MKKITLLVLLLLTVIGARYFLFGSGNVSNYEDYRFIDYTADYKNIKLFYRDSAGARFGSLGNLKSFLDKQDKKLVFAMNGGMFSPAYHPVGLYIENGVEINFLDTASGHGNFYLKPNGIFFIGGNGADIKTTGQYRDTKVNYATQSGPMLVINGELHPEFRQNSPNINIRNGVGVLKNGKVIFSISKEPVNFYDFATHFKNMGCINALYLDGFVSKMYCPEKGRTDSTGNFGVIIGVTE